MNDNPISLIAHPGLLVAIVILVHASLQVGVSVLTLLSGHSLRKKQAHARLVRLNFAYIIGVVTISFLILNLVLQILSAGHTSDISPLWPIICFSLVIIGIVVMLNYYRRAKGTVLWIPRRQAEYLSSRAKKTKHSFEAAALGGMTVIAELPISLVFYLTIGLLIHILASDSSSLWWALAYSISISLPLIAMVFMVGGGYRISQIQRWREHNKTFLKYTTGIGMIAAAVYILSFYILEVN